MKQLALITLLLSLSTTASAAGIGVYGIFSGGKSYFRSSLSEYSFLKSIDNNFYTISGGGGFIFEAVSLSGKPVDFRYRINAGAEKMYSSKGILEGMYRVHLVNSFYLGIVNKDFFSLSLGS